MASARLQELDYRLRVQYSDYRGTQLKVTIDIPDTMQQSLQHLLGPNLAQAAKESLAIAWYQAEKLSIGQVAEFLGISVYEAEGMMKSRGVEAPYSLEDYEQDSDTLNRLLKP